MAKETASGGCVASGSCRKYKKEQSSGGDCKAATMTATATVTITAKEKSYINNQPVVIATEIGSGWASVSDYGKLQQENGKENNPPAVKGTIHRR